MSGLELVGGVSAAFGLAQTGLSLAKAIKETAKDYKDARDDIAGLARVIESTLSRVAEVQGLINDNNKTQVFSDNGINTIKNSFMDLERIVRDLIKLLTTAGVPEDTRKTIRPEDVAVTRFQKVGWIGLKSEVKDKKDELSNIQIDLTLAIICAQARSTVSPTIVAALRLRVVDLETQRRQHALNGSAHTAVKPNMPHDTTSTLNTNSNTLIPPAARVPSTSSAASSLPGVSSIPNGDGGVAPGPNDKPVSDDQTPSEDMQQGIPDQATNPSGQQQSTGTRPLPREVDAQCPGKNKVKAQQPTSNKPDVVRYAHLVVIDGSGMVITPLMPPKHPNRLSRAKPQVTAQVWAGISSSVRDAVATTLKYEYPLSRGFGWHLAYARDAETAPAWKRLFARILHLQEPTGLQRSSRDENRCYMILFVAGRMFDEEAVSSSPPPPFPFGIPVAKPVVSAVTSESTSQVNRIEHRDLPISPEARSGVVGPKRLRRATTRKLSDRRRHSDADTPSSASSMSTGSSNIKVHRRPLEGLVRERRDYLAENRKLREKIEEQDRTRSAVDRQDQYIGYDTEPKVGREMETIRAPRQYQLVQHESKEKKLEEEKRTLEALERRKRDEAEEERRVLEKIERRKREAEEQERHQWAKFEEMKAKEAAEKREAEKKIENALRQRLVEADLSPSEIEKIMSKDAGDERKQQQQQSISIPMMAERTPEEEAQLFNDAMLRFTGRML